MSSNPYTEGRREWDERYGSALAQARNWRLAAFVALVVAVLAVGGIAYIGAQSKIKPYVVTLDHMGNPIAMARPVSGKVANQRIIEATVARWVWEVRTVLPDAPAEKALLKRVYALLGPQAVPVINQWYKAHPPFGDRTVNPQITSILPVGPHTWQVDWTETTFQSGHPSVTRTWEANIVTGLDPEMANRPQMVLYNPLGIYIQSITWTQLIHQHGGSQ